MVVTGKSPSSACTLPVIGSRIEAGSRNKSCGECLLDTLPSDLYCKKICSDVNDRPRDWEC